MTTKANLVIDQGTTFSVDITLTDENGDALNLNNFNANAVIKKWYTSTTSITMGASINAAMGVITLQLDANTTTDMSAGRYVYDVNITDLSSNSVSRIIEGIVTVTPSVTSGVFSTNNTWFANG